MPAYTPTTGYQRAQELIAECIRTKSTVLDLGNLSLREVPPELGECVWVEKLNLGDYFYYDEETDDWIRGQDKTGFTNLDRNQLDHVPIELTNLKKIKVLSFHNNKITQIEYLVSLTLIEQLNFSRNALKQIEGLERLRRIEYLNLSGNELALIQGLESLERLKQLNINDNRLSQIEGLDCLGRIEYLDLSDNKLVQIESLKRLRRIEYLDLSDNKLVQIESLKRLERIEYLDLSYNKLEQIEYLEDLGCLKYIDFSYNLLTQIEGLESLRSLESLKLSENGIKKIEGLSSLVNLKDFDISKNQIRRIEGLESLRSLESLKLSENKIKKTEGLSSLVSLKDFDISKNQIRRIEGLESLRSLESLKLSENKIKKTEGLSSLVSLKDFDISKNQIRRIEGLESLRSLESLKLSENKIKKTEGLSSLVSLKDFDISKNQIRRIEGLESLNSLESLKLSSNEIKKIEGLNELDALVQINLNSNQLAEIEGVSSLLCLESLSLGYNQVKIIKGLDNLTSLEKLDLSGNKLKKIEGLQSLSALWQLVLRYNQIKKVENLERLIALEQLYLADNRIEKIEGLANNTLLEYIEFGSNQIRRIEGLSTLCDLEWLELDNNLIERIEGFDQLNSLVWLELSENRITKLEGLDQLSSLEHLDVRSNQIKRIEGLGNLQELERLNLSNNKIEKIEGLENLISLRELYLESNKITKLESFNELVSLTELDLRDNNINEESINFLDQSGLDILAINGDIKDIPIELLSDGRYGHDESNCLPDIRAWYAALSMEKPITNRLFKVIVCGNGTVGKTQLVNRLLGRPFQENTDSTHGIQIEQSSPLQLIPELEESVQLYLWDFGGQEVYHQTHRLFLAYRALYLVVFDADTFEAATQNDPLTREAEASRSLAFWLSEIKARDNSSPIIVVQNKVDDHSKLRIVFQMTLTSDLLPDEQVAVSAKTERNFADLREAIYRQLRKTKEYTMPVPASWHRAREATLAVVAAAKEGGPHKLSVVDFQNEICVSAGITEESHQGALLQYFHATGLLFYDKYYLEDDIILNQQWALDAIYAVLERSPPPNSAVARFRQRCQQMKGCFFAYDLPFPEDQYTEDDRKLFLGFMKSAKICFQLRTADADEEPLYQLVRELSLAPGEEAITVWQSHQADAVHFRYHHRYHLHAGIIERFIIKMATHCELHQLWRNGAFVNWQQNWAWINVNYHEKEIVISVAGPQRDYLLSAIRNVFQKIQGDNSTIDEQVSLDSEQWIQLVALRDAKENQAVTVYTTDKEAKIKCERLQWALHHDAKADFKGKEEIIQQVIQEEPTVLKKTIPSQRIKAHIAEGRIKEALTELVEYFPRVVGLQGEFKRMNEQYIMGVLTAQDFDVKHNRLSQRILRLVEELEASNDQDVQLQIVAKAKTDISTQLDRIEATINKVNETTSDNNQRLQALQTDIPVILGYIDDLAFSRAVLQQLIDYTLPLLQQLSSLPVAGAETREQAHKALKPGIPVSQKIKLIIPLIPGILKYETELAGKPLDVLRAVWADLKAGREEGLRRVFLEG